METNQNVFLQATPKAKVALQSGRLLTPSQDSLCGVSLQPRETYVITGEYPLYDKFLMVF